MRGSAKVAEKLCCFSGKLAKKHGKRAKKKENRTRELLAQRTVLLVHEPLLFRTLIEEIIFRVVIIHMSDFEMCMLNRFILYRILR